jgi:hypothetical protein
MKIIKLLNQVTVALMTSMAFKLVFSYLAVLSMCGSPLWAAPPEQSALDARIAAQSAAAKGKLKPLMGWSTWNKFKQVISEDKVMAIADAMAAKGFTSAGYVFLNLDDCWQASSRDDNGSLQWDAGKFPGREGLVKKLADKGMKLGLYSSCGTHTCEDMPGSMGFEEQDALLFAKWGIGFLKYDYCHVQDMITDTDGRAFATTTPKVLYIGATSLSSPSGEIRINAGDAVSLTGEATIADGYLDGLSEDRGTAVFNLNVPLSGKYLLAIGYSKTASDGRRFAMAAINGVSYEIWFPRSTDVTGMIDPARVDVSVELKAGDNTIILSNPIKGQLEDTKLRYRRMGTALKNATAALGRGDILFNICEHGRTKPWEWAHGYATSWRVSGDISANWRRIMQLYEIALPLYSYQKPGGYNDPDMLEVGNGDLNAEQNKAHFTLWAMFNAPLVLGMDVSAASGEVIKIVTNPEIIALDQDDAMLQAKCVLSSDGIDILVKPLINGEAAVCFFNKSADNGATVSIDLATLNRLDDRVGLASGSKYLVKDLWGASPGYKTNNAILKSGFLPRHGVSVFRVKVAAR